MSYRPSAFEHTAIIHIMTSSLGWALASPEAPPYAASCAGLEICLLDYLRACVLACWSRTSKQILARILVIIN